MKERRRYKRFSARLLVTTVYRDEQGKIVTEDSICAEEISAGGLRIVFPRHLAKGKILDLKVFLFSDPIHLPAQGKVVWSSEKKALELALNGKRGEQTNELFWIGIEFIDIDFFTRERIMRWIKKEFDLQNI